MVQHSAFGEGAMGSVLILSGQSAVAGDIRIQDSGEFTPQAVVHAGVPF